MEIRFVYKQNVNPIKIDQLAEFSLNPVIKSKQVLSKRLLNYSSVSESAPKIGEFPDRVKSELSRILALNQG